MTRAIVVAIDGPAGAGKSTIAKQVAEQTGLTLVDTGAIYRALALSVVRQGLPHDAEAALAQVARDLPIRFDHDKVFLDDEDVSEDIRRNEISMAASTISRHPAVRAALLELQRDLGRRDEGAVLEGRDIGTVVFPDAEVKVFLTASPAERARRRAMELEERGQGAPFERVLQDIEARDKQDMEREVAPLKPADDAVVLDSTQLTQAEVIARIIETIARARA